METLEPKKNYISWPVLALMDFVTVIGFDDLTYNFQNQGMGVITSWVIMLFLYVIPYSLMVGQLGSVFNHEGGGLTSWVRGTSGEFLGYFTAWTYWAASIPYVVDTANSIVVGLGWAYNGNAKMQSQMSNGWFAFWTLVTFVVFIFVQSRFKRSLEVLSTIGGIAMFGMTVLFVLMTFAGLAAGGHIATQPMNIHTIIPKFDLHYLTTIGLLIYAVNGYLLTCGLSAFIMLLGIFLPSMNDIFNWLLNLNGIISPGVTCWIFFAFIKIRQDSQKFPSDYVYIKNDKVALAVGWWCLIITAVATIFGIGPQDVSFGTSTWWYELVINFVAIIVLIGLGTVLPYVTRRENRSTTGSAFTRLQWTGILAAIFLTIVGDLYLGGSNYQHNIISIVVISIVGIALVVAFGWKEYNLKEA
ncbi:amino acid permease [Companilactobacillus mindensis]|nr:amino acid permease [Companilactobacillus mindensis]GEO79309.1 hypothetical protein LMI01_16400 [Companilactobacillus mindensis]